MKAKIETIYLDWCNNFLTVEIFAEYYGLSIEKAHKVIDLGREINYKKYLA
jgi:hypothetical protein